MNFTLGLSGWTANDWSRAGNFDLLAPRAKVDDFTKRRVFDGLKKTWFETPERLARKLNLDKAIVLGALAAYTQAGRAIFDLDKNVYRVRELTRDPLPMSKLRFASEREESAARFLTENAVTVSKCRINPEGVFEIVGAVKVKEKKYEVSLSIDRDQRLAQANCTCNFFMMNKLFKGPCEHILAVRLKSAESVIGSK
jgi:predicted nucleic acid-binding Zn finger protein